MACSSSGVKYSGVTVSPGTRCADWGAGGVGVGVGVMVWVWVWVWVWLRFVLLASHHHNKQPNNNNNTSKNKTAIRYNCKQTHQQPLTRLHDRIRCIAALKRYRFGVVIAIQLTWK